MTQGKNIRYSIWRKRKNNLQWVREQSTVQIEANKPAKQTDIKPIYLPSTIIHHPSFNYYDEQLPHPHLVFLLLHLKMESQRRVVHTPGRNFNKRYEFILSIFTSCNAYWFSFTQYKKKAIWLLEANKLI